MTYFKQLHPWCVTRRSRNQEPLVVARFRRRDDAVAYLQVLQRSVKDIVLAICFDAQAVKKTEK
jgi:hypothetical protein